MATVEQLVDFGRRSYFAGKRDLYSSVVKELGSVIRRLAEKDQIDLAIQLEGVWYNSLVKLVESEDNYRSAFSGHYHALWEAGTRRRKLASSGDGGDVCFVIPNGVLLGHTQVMLEIIRSWQLDNLAVRAVVVSLSSFDDKLLAGLRGLGIRYFCPPSRGLGIVAIAEWAREVIRRENCTTAIWVSVPCVVSFLFGFGIAPRQVFWSLKFHPVHLGPSVLHIAMTPPGRGDVHFDGKIWKRFSPPLSVPDVLGNDKKISDLRDRLDGEFIFGALARTEKFNSIAYVDAVVDIVSRCPGSIFVYTGHQDSPTIVEGFRRVGLTKSLRYVGWVDTNLYAQSLDVFLETFPFGCGVTGAQAVNAGTRTVSLWCDETLPRYYFESLGSARELFRHWRIETEVDGYVRAAVECFREGVSPPHDQVKAQLKELDRDKARAFYALLRSD